MPASKYMSSKQKPFCAMDNGAEQSGTEFKLGITVIDASAFIVFFFIDKWLSAKLTTSVYTPKT